MDFKDPDMQKDASSQDLEKVVSQVPAQVLDSNGHLNRGLKERHVQFIAIGGTIGVGLFLGIGSALATGGPLSLFLGYVFTSAGIWAMMQGVGEMASLLPLPGMIAQSCSRFVDPALGFSVGWNQWYNCAISIAAETSGAVLLVQFWTDINPAAWISVVLVLVFALNFSAVAIYGEAEFFFASLKIITIIGLLILGLILDLGGGPNHDRLGFRYWVHPGAMNEYIATGSTGRFLGLFSTLISAAYAFGGAEQVAVAAGETQNPTRSIPKAIRRVLWRLVLFYVLGSFFVGLLVPYTNPDLLSGSGVKQSPWVIAIKSAGIPVLPHILNAVLISSAASSANANLYTGSRYMFALAQQGQAPRFLLKCNKQGVPYYCVGITASFGLLAYMTVSSTASNVFHWLSSLVTISYLLTWTCLCFAYTRFRRALLLNDVDRNTLPFKGSFQPYTAWIGIVFFSIVLVFNGFAVFTHGRWSAQDFVSAYIGMPLFALLFFGWKLVKKTKIVPISEIDIYTGRVVGDERDSPVLPKNRLQKFMSKLL
ncbi:Amino acid/polyamine transporter I [Niveomyces insectorum RCEF 264]|uniref:Amino acid/polyamine transporter I n=1 Tax=Niveomyces insectorum RCEF 264 TaxID=1081102 RepID=A0A168AC12_9HYPO|nr:Amino acid/polyamine transporter I [Niveomyces insectorum RCEF 264]